MKKRELILEFFVIVVIAGILSIFDIRVCPVFLLFKHPCPGCGLTRSIMSLLKGDFVMSFKYNILGIPFVICFIVMIVLFIFKKDDIVSKFLYKHRVLVIILAIILAIVVEIINLNNPLLY